MIKKSIRSGQALPAGVQISRSNLRGLASNNIIQTPAVAPSPLHTVQSFPGQAPRTSNHLMIAGRTRQLRNTIGIV